MNGPLKSIIELFANPKVRKLIFTSYFMFCVTSLSYYVTGMLHCYFLVRWKPLIQFYSNHLST